MRYLIVATIVALASTSRMSAADDFKLEPGFTLLFNGKDLTGWKTTKGEALEGKAETPEKRFRANEGVLVVDYKVKGNVVINSVKTFEKDVHIKFEFLPGEGCNNDLYLRGMKFDLKKGDVKNLKDGEWHLFEIIVKDNKAEFKCNGEVQRKMTAKPGATPLGIRAEFGPIQIRRVRYSETP